MKSKNIVLIGMPSSGKTTTGQLLAKKTGRIFIDTDVLITQRENKSCRDIVNTEGLQRFLQIQEEVIIELEVEGYIIATGGGAIYSEASMFSLKSNGTVVFLKLRYDEIEKRIAQGRRFARSDGQSLMDIYNERTPLYEKYADITIECYNKIPEEIVEEIIKV